MTRHRRTHWLRGNQASRIPRRIITLDSEATSRIVDDRERQTFRLAYAMFDELNPETLEPIVSTAIGTLDTRELWEWVESCCSKRHRTVLFAHNLAYDVRLCGGLVELPRMGWELRGFALDRYRCWLRWKKGDLSLSMADTISYVGKSLAAMADPLHMVKMKLPNSNAPVDHWLQRCKADTELTREIVFRLLRFLRDEECGDFRLSGPAQGFAQFRHRFMQDKMLLVHDDRGQLDRERESSFAGRCEVWQHGRVDQYIAEWDYSCAYARVARDADLPIRYRGPVSEPRDLARLEPRRGVAFLASCRVDTQVPVVPTRREDKILWPTGRFLTTLWDCEIELAREFGAKVEVKAAWLYRTAPILREWATYILGEIEDKNGDLEPVARATLKQWSRTLIGRFGLRYPIWEQCGEMPDFDCSLIRYVSADTEEKGQWLRLGRQVFDHSGTEESYDSAPAVMAYIIALSRIRLWRAMVAAGFENVVYVDTDSVLVTNQGHANLFEFAATNEGEGLRLKAQHDGGFFYAPRQIIVGGETRIAGLPKHAEQSGEREYRATVWEGANHALERKAPSEIMLTRRTIRIRGKDNRRRHLSKGATAAYKMR